MAKILLVEDDTNLSEIYQARMEAEGYTVVGAADGESALALAAKEKPDLIISDVMMPKISGFEMLDILRNTDGLKHTRVIMLTALGQAEDKTRAESLGADRYLVKSQVTLEDIVTAAKELLGEGDEPALPTPAELAAPTITAAPAAPEPIAVVAEPVQAAPTGPLAATEPVQIPQPPTADAPADPPADAPNDDTATTATDDATLPPPAEPAAIAEPPAESEPVAAPAPTPVAAAPAPSPTAEPSDDATSPKAEASESADAVPAPTTEIAPLTELLPATDPTTEPEEEETPEPAPAVETPAPSQPVAATPPIVEEDAPAPVPTPALETPAVPTPTPAAPAEAPVEDTPEPTPAPTPAPLATAAAIDEKVVANAVDKLLAKSPSNPNAAIAPGQNTSERPHKKIISPISHPEAPSLQELLAKEEARDVGVGATVAPIATPASEPAPVANDEAAAAEMLAKAQAGKAINQKDQKDFDPNSISL